MQILWKLEAKRFFTDMFSKDISDKKHVINEIKLI